MHCRRVFPSHRRERAASLASLAARVSDGVENGSDVPAFTSSPVPWLPVLGKQDPGATLHQGSKSLLLSWTPAEPAATSAHIQLAGCREPYRNPGSHCGFFPTQATVWSCQPLPSHTLRVIGLGHSGWD